MSDVIDTRPDLACDGGKDYNLYYHPYSICSLQVLFTVRLRGKPLDKKHEMRITRQVVDVFRAEQVKEHFLCDVNPEGQVPVLMEKDHPSSAICDSLKMTLYMATCYPKLIPKEHKLVINKLLRDNHRINYFSLSFPERPSAAAGLVNMVQSLLDDPDISDRYRKALEFKLDVVNRTKVGGVIPAETKRNEQATLSYLEEVEALMNAGEGWIFGAEPTALDAHLVPFLLRVTEVGRGHLIPNKLKSYRDWAAKTADWVAIMDGRAGTMAPLPPQ